MSSCMVHLLSKLTNRMIPWEGMGLKAEASVFLYSLVLIPYILCATATWILCRIAKVDWAFPATPRVSSEAKDLISKVTSKSSGLLYRILTNLNGCGLDCCLFFVWLCVQLLVKDSSKRLCLEDIMKHPWIQKNAEPSGSCIKRKDVTGAKVNEKWVCKIIFWATR
jgi:hypothetical protein